jgi:hypothetical protein
MIGRPGKRYATVARSLGDMRFQARRAIVSGGVSTLKPAGQGGCSSGFEIARRQTLGDLWRVALQLGDEVGG